MEAKSTYVVLGATGGIGLELCRRLVQSGANVVGASRNPDRLREVAGIHPFTMDATDFDQVDACMAETDKAFGRVDGIVNCVGSLLLRPAHTTRESDWNSTIASNLTTAFATVRSGAKAMMHTGGSIVLLSSVAGRVGLANHEAIAAAKAGVIGLTMAAAASYAERNIRVNCVAPGLVRTGMTARLTTNEEALKASAAMHPLGRIGEPADIASAIAWLLDPSNHWITGQVLGVDGGMSTVRNRSKS